MKGADKSKKPEYEDVKKMIRKIINKYKRILRTKDEIEDLEQDSYIAFYTMSNYIEKKYGANVRNFNTMLYNAISWEINRMIDRKYLLIRKNFVSEKEQIYSLEADDNLTQYLAEDCEFINHIEQISVVDDILKCLNDVEKFVLVRNFGLYNSDILSLDEIADELKISYYKVCNIKKLALNKIRREMKINEKFVYLGGV